MVYTFFFVAYLLVSHTPPSRRARIIFMQRVKSQISIFGTISKYSVKCLIFRFWAFAHPIFPNPTLKAAVSAERLCYKTIAFVNGYCSDQSL